MATVDLTNVSDWNSLRNNAPGTEAPTLRDLVLSIYLYGEEEAPENYYDRVSDAVDAKITAQIGKQPLRLRPDEWDSGETIWLIDMAGEPRGIGSALHTLAAGLLKDKTVKMITRDTDGGAKVGTLAGAIAETRTSTDKPT